MSIGPTWEHPRVRRHRVTRGFTQTANHFKLLLTDSTPISRSHDASVPFPSLPRVSFTEGDRVTPPSGPETGSYVDVRPSSLLERSPEDSHRRETSEPQTVHSPRVLYTQPTPSPNHLLTLLTYSLTPHFLTNSRHSGHVPRVVLDDSVLTRRSD